VGTRPWFPRDALPAAAEKEYPPAVLCVFLRTLTHLSRRGRLCAVPGASALARDRGQPEKGPPPTRALAVSIPSGGYLGVGRGLLAGVDRLSTIDEGLALLQPS
jgi:hypothetical protein